MTNLVLNVEQINKMDKLAIVENEIVKSRFIQIYDTIWGEGGEAAYEKESRIFNQILSDYTNNLRTRATNFSLFTAFIDLAVCGLSLERGVRALCYLQGRNYVTGKNAQGQSTYEGRAVLTVSGYGELVLRSRSGQIKYADNPVVVYENDEFSFSERGGQKSIDYVCKMPHTGKSVIACFIKIVRSDNSIDYSVMLPEDWQRLMNYSSKENKGTANSLYSSNNGSIDTGFLQAKCIKHAFKTYPKVRIGRGTQLETTQEDDIDDTIYGVEASSKTTAQKAESKESFGPEPDTSAGVTIDTSSDGVGDDGAF